MSETVDYYLSLNSPWSYLGHRRFAALVDTHRLSVNVHPVDYAAVIFPATGGLPLPKRSAERQAYRLVELERWREHLGVALNIEPKFWPVNEVPGACMVLAAGQSGGGAAMALAGALLSAVWAGERDIADRATLLAVAGECGLDAAALMAAADTDEMVKRRIAESEQAVERGVFGAPFYIYKEQPFWGQDRLDMLERAVGKA
ncbi:MAG: 2-hydroxychromene-2-carboxylate isomerase [Gammaproteobacteria bacterium]|nr:2-hydroxychromene-2-carboxylate isomerase [Gammaproteobacteria bacterium]NIM74678.1 2-hydroxychromene-2-carboxylate isomerase [Gammaproteobacteria bacterium]NIN37455.1 2-hydroxychromene-2-carboxylate isomerase [Gammaproteobacteria bacterium]NIO26511.1 2-hydroxychromene-2-carboxylate isomerase [Gammaproteobacteria bacterium]NIO67063.1 2-hydroxychromene-2-carboxylate isomerase [Gammaproteobacteria bacterium]